MLTRYYIAARHIAEAVERGQNADCTFPSLENATEEAKRRIREGEVNSCLIVEIVRVVRKAEPPIEIEDF